MMKFSEFVQTTLNFIKWGDCNVKKFLLLQDVGIHEKNKHLRECLVLQRGIQNTGHQCDVWGKGYDFPKPDIDSYDVVIDMWEAYHEHLDLSAVKTTKFLWVCDSHINGEDLYLDIAKKGNFDAILKTSSGMFLDFPSYWFKPWIDLDFIDKKENNKEHFIGFCGNKYSERSAYIDNLTHRYGLKQDIMVIGKDMVDAINSYKIHFNKSLGDPHGFSYRIAETLACQTLLLTNSSYMNEQVGLVDGVNCLLYDTYEDILEQLEWIKNDEAAIQEISQNGYELRNQFSSENRALELIEILRGMK